MNVVYFKKSPWLVSCLFVIAYVALGKLGLYFSLTPPNVTPFYPASGLAWAAAILWGYRAYPALFVAAVIVNLFPIATLADVGPALIVGVVIALGKVLSVYVGTYIYRALRQKGPFLLTARDYLIFCIVAVFWVVSPTVGVTALYFGGLVTAENFVTIWLTWWLGDSIGILMLTPLLLAVSRRQSLRAFYLAVPETIRAIFVALITASLVFYSGYPVLYLLTGVCLYYALHLCRIGLITVNLVVAVISVLATYYDYGVVQHYPPVVQLAILQIFITFNSIVSTVFWCTVNANYKLNIKWSEAESKSLLDPLTGTLNRRGFEEKALSFFKNEVESGSASILLMDLDDFKKINDRFGHDAGDQALIAFATWVKLIIRDEDIFARIGGEEFTVLLKNHNLEKAVSLADRIREAVESQQLATTDGRVIRFTVSIGVCQVIAGKDIMDCLREADKLLYEAKNSGRNRVVFKEDKLG